MNLPELIEKLKTTQKMGYLRHYEKAILWFGIFSLFFLACLPRVSTEASSVSRRTSPNNSTIAPQIGSLQYSLVTASPTPQPLIPTPPAGFFYHGVYPGGVSGEESDLTITDLHSYEQAAGKSVTWVYFSNNWYESRLFPEQTAAWIRTAGSVPYIRYCALSVLLLYRMGRNEGW